MAVVFEVGAVIVAIVLLYVLFKFLSNPLHLIANSIFGIVVFYIMNAVFGVGIPITLLSVGVVALGGILGVILVFLLHVTGLGF